MAKTYLIPSPEKLKEAVDGMKWSTEKQKVLDFIAVWNVTIRKCAPFPIKVTLELGRQAILFREKRDKKEPLGTMNLKAAREYAKGLVEA